jgi:hypothetical protein
LQEVAEFLLTSRNFLQLSETIYNFDVIGQSEHFKKLNGVVINVGKNDARAFVGSRVDYA